MDVKNFRFSPEPELPEGGTPPPAVSAVPEVKPEKTFTQKELDEIIVTRLAKEQAKAQKKLDELYQKLGVSDETKIDEVVVKSKKHDELLIEITNLKEQQEKAGYEAELRKLNVDDDFIDFVLTKVEKGDDFVKNAKEYLEKNPKVLKDTFRRMNSGLDLNGGSAPDFANMSTEEYLRWRATHNPDGTEKRK